MKKTLIAAAATIACASAFSQVTLYGVADAGITRVTGYAQGSVTQLNSGIMEGSRWGIKGSEDLGGGYRALFTLESRVELDTGGQSNRPTSGNQLPDRLAADLLPAMAGALTNVAIATLTRYELEQRDLRPPGVGQAGHTHWRLSDGVAVHPSV